MGSAAAPAAPVAGAGPGLPAALRLGRVRARRRAGEDRGRPLTGPRPSPQDLKGVLFDVDGTLCDSDPLHFATFQEFLAERSFNGGAKIDEAFFREKIAGRHNPDIFADLFPQLSAAEQAALGEEKEALWRRMARGKLEPVAGLEDFLGWVDRQGLRKAAVTNAPRLNAEVSST